VVHGDRGDFDAKELVGFRLAEIGQRGDEAKTIAVTPAALSPLHGVLSSCR